MWMRTRLGDISEKDNDEEDNGKDDDDEEDDENNDDNEENQGKRFEVRKEDISEGWEGGYVMGLGRRKSKEGGEEGQLTSWKTRTALKTLPLIRPS